jgi:hypothetical protein
VYEVEKESEKVLEQYQTIQVQSVGGFGVVLEAVAFESLESSERRFYSVSNYTITGAKMRLAAMVSRYDGQKNTRGEREYGGIPLKEAIKNGSAKSFVGLQLPQKAKPKKPKPQ